MNKLYVKKNEEYQHVMGSNKRKKNEFDPGSA
jgi:hypothetical protein